MKAVHGGALLGVRSSAVVARGCAHSGFVGIWALAGWWVALAAGATHTIDPWIGAVGDLGSHTRATSLQQEGRQGVRGG